MGANVSREDDDEAAHLRETLRRRASIEARTGLKWTTGDTVKTILLGAMLGASGKEDRDPDGRLPPMSW